MSQKTHQLDVFENLDLFSVGFELFVSKISLCF